MVDKVEQNEIIFHHVMMPRTVMCFTIPLPDLLREKSIHEAMKIGDEMNHSTNVKASMSNYEVHKTTDVYHDILVEITRMTKRAPWLDPDYVGYTLVNSWTGIYTEGDHTIPHVHHAAASFCYYIQADESASPLVFDGTPLEIKPFTGLCVMFEGGMMHSVPRQEYGSGKPRIILAGNFETDITSWETEK